MSNYKAIRRKNKHQESVSPIRHNHLLTPPIISMTASLLFLLAFLCGSQAFTPKVTILSHITNTCSSSFVLNAKGSDSTGGGGGGNASDDENTSDTSFSDFAEEDFPTAGVVIEDLDWRVNKLRLEEENKRRFLKAKPRFLPYAECRKWVIAFNRWDSKTEWRNWIAEGEKRNSYIPSRPDEYYKDTGDWISWDHFLGVQSADKADKDME